MKLCAHILTIVAAEAHSSTGTDLGSFQTFYKFLAPVNWFANLELPSFGTCLEWLGP